MSDGTRVCKQMGLKVKQTFQCSQWELADGLKNAGLQNEGMVRLKGTQEIVIE